MNARKTIFAFATGLLLTGLATPVARGQSEADDAGTNIASKPPASPVNVFTGTVVDAEGNAVVGATVAVADVESGRISWEDTVSAFAPEEKVLLFFTKRNGKRAGTTTTDEQGQFAFRGLKYGRYNLAVVEPTLGVTLLADLPFSRNGAPIRITRDLSFKVASTLTVKGRVLDSDGNPASGATVAVADTTYGYILQMGVTMAVTDTTHGHILQMMDISSSEQIDGFAWFVIHSGRAGKDRTNDAGEFTIRGLRPGTYNLVAMHAEKGASLLQDVDVSDDARPLDLKLDPPTYAEGTVKGLSLPVGIFGASCSLVPEGLPDNMVFRHAVDLSDENPFRVGPLPPAKRWRLVVENPVPRQGYRATMLDAPFKAGKLEVDLNSGTQFSGEVRGPKGKPLGGVSVLAKPLADAGPTIGAVSGVDGKYTVRGLAPGQYELVALRHAMRTAPG